MLSFTKAGKGKRNLVFLPGWTKRKEDYAELLGLLAEKYTIYALDLPGFGETPIERPYDLADYAVEVKGFLEKKKINKPILVGHSFGGRVAIKFVISNPKLVSRLILINSAGIERKNLLIKALGKIKIKSEFLKNIFGSKDYLEAKGNLRETLKKVVAENLEPELSKIKVPTLIIWGRYDHTTPLWQGELMHKLITGSHLEIIEGDHGIPYRQAGEVAKIITAWL